MYGFDDYGGTAIFTLTADLEGGDTFNVNAFEIFTGHHDIHSSAMRLVLDNVDITATAEPANDWVGSVIIVLGGRSPNTNVVVFPTMSLTRPFLHMMAEIRQFIHRFCVFSGADGMVTSSG